MLLWFDFRNKHSRWMTNGGIPTALGIYKEFTTINREKYSHCNRDSNYNSHWPLRSRKQKHKTTIRITSTLGVHFHLKSYCRQYRSLTCAVDDHMLKCLSCPCIKNYIHYTTSILKTPSSTMYLNTQNSWCLVKFWKLKLIKTMEKMKIDR